MFIALDVGFLLQAFNNIFGVKHYITLNIEEGLLPPYRGADKTPTRIGIFYNDRDVEASSSRNVDFSSSNTGSSSSKHLAESILKHIAVYDNIERYFVPHVPNFNQNHTSFYIPFINIDVNITKEKVLDSLPSDYKNKERVIPISKSLVDISKLCLTMHKNGTKEFTNFLTINGIKHEVIGPYIYFTSIEGHQISILFANHLSKLMVTQNVATSSSLICSQLKTVRTELEAIPSTRGSDLITLKRMVTHNAVELSKISDLQREFFKPKEK